MTGIEEGDLFLPPLFTVLTAKVLGAVLLEGVKQDLLLDLDHVLTALVGDVHESALALHSDDLLDQRSSLSLVVQTHDGGLELLKQLTGGLEGTVHILEQEATEAALLGLVEDADLSLGNNTQRTLRADEDLVEIRAGRVLGSGRGIDNITVGKNDLHLQNHIVDLTVLGRANADTAVSQEAAHGRAGQAGGIVHGCLTDLVGRPLDVLVDRTRAALDVHTVGVDLEDLVHSLGIQNDTAAHGDSAALRTAAGTPGGNGDLVVVGDLDNLGDLRRILGADDEVSLGHAAATVCPHTGQPVIVHAVRHFVNGARRAILLSHCILKLGEDHGEQKLIHLVLHDFLLVLRPWDEILFYTLIIPYLRKKCKAKNEYFSDFC